MAYYHADEKTYRQKFHRLNGKKARYKARHLKASMRWAKRLNTLLDKIFTKNEGGK